MEGWTPAEWDVHEVGSGTDPIELAAAVFQWDHQHHEPMPSHELRERFRYLSSDSFDKLMTKARDEGLIRVKRRFGQTALVYPLRMV